MAKSKFFINLVSGSSTVEEHLTRNHMLKGLNPASGTVREKMAKSKFLLTWPAAVAQWKNTQLVIICCEGFESCFWHRERENGKKQDFYKLGQRQ